MRSDALIQVGSTTKVLNAALVMSLVDDGTVDLDTSITVYAGEEWMPDVTLRQLLSMTSGVDSGQILDIGDDAGAVKRFVALQRDVPPLAKPGEMFFYSNAGSTIAGRIAEIVTSQSWDDAFRDRILAPAGLEHSVTTWDQAVFHRLAIGHRHDQEGAVDLIRPARFGRCRAPAGSTLWSTASDLVRFAAIMLRGGVALDGTRVLSEDAVTAMHVRYAEVPHSVLADQWCLGPLVRTVDGIDAFGHAGGAFGGGSLLYWFPDLQIAIATASNTPAVAQQFSRRVHEAVLLTHGVETEAPVDPTPVEGVDVGAFVGRYAFSGGVTTFEERDGALVFTVDGMAHPVAMELEAIGDRLFRVPGQATGDPVLFIGDEDGKATHLLMGVWAMRRIG